MDIRLPQLFRKASPSFKHKDLALTHLNSIWGRKMFTFRQQQSFHRGDIFQLCKISKHNHLPITLPGESSTGGLQNESTFFSDQESQKHLSYNPLVPCLLASLSCLWPMWTSWKTRDEQMTPLEKPHQLRSFCLNSVHCWTWEHPFRKTVFKGTLYSRHATLSLPWLRCTRLLQRDYSHTAGTNHLSASTNNEMN